VMPVRRLPAGAGNRRRQHETPKCAALPKPQVDDADAAEEFADPGEWRTLSTQQPTAEQAFPDVWDDKGTDTS
jgi:hypothetical protein